MNLLYIFLSIFFSTVAPNFTNTGGGTVGHMDGTVTNPGGTEGDKPNDGDFIILTDTNP